MKTSEVHETQYTRQYGSQHSSLYSCSHSHMKPIKANPLLNTEVDKGNFYFFLAVELGHNVNQPFSKEPYDYDVWYRLSNRVI